jgi:hypothetical protein
MPTVLKKGKFRFFFFSNEGSEPMHIHVESNEKYAKFWLDPVQLARSIGYSAKELNEIRGLVLENLNLFREKWNEYFKY